MTETFQHVPVDQILINPQQPRSEFDPEKLEDLAESIRTHGLIQALAVEEAGGGWFILHDGERRLRAAKLAGLTTVPCTIIPPLNGTADRDRLLRAVIANEQRAALNPIEQAKAYQRLHELGYKMHEVATATGRSETHISTTRKLLLLDPEIQGLIARRLLPRDHSVAKALLSIPNSEARVKLAQRLARPGVSITAVRTACTHLIKALERQAQAETLAAETTPAFIATRRPQHDPDTKSRWPLVRAAAQGVCDACDVNPGLPNAPEPAWALIVQSTETTCQRCNIRPANTAAALSVCKACPLVEMLRRLAGTEK